VDGNNAMLGPKKKFININVVGLQGGMGVENMRKNGKMNLPLWK